ncbi:ATP-binding protein [Nonomuraea guangzhouensis]|uniref:ATP-binding protein n=1 Tax=Nonomuraea guangzhouensis TaxID=1291555 RepID=A0ABW4GP07_9ACTN|nr:LuxR family transcriptional regulator [Nonomuraea guangzhouensis]
MLYGRVGESAAIDDLIEAVGAGEGRALVLRGAAGVGKSALLDLAAAKSTSPVLRASGIEAETGLAYAALHELLRPVTGLLDTLPGPQRDALRGALGLARGSADRFLVSAGVLSLLAEAAAGEGLLVLVDDFQWIDQASADALLFAARRLRNDGVGLLLAIRGEMSVRGLRELPVNGLDADSARLLLRGAAPQVQSALIEQTGGNPLALGEIARLLTPEQLAGRSPLPDPLPGGALLFGEQVAALSDNARLVALIAAVEGSGDLDVIVRAARILDVDPAALVEAEAAGLVVGEGSTITFRHPLVRSAVHDSAGSVRLRGVHAALAETLEGDRRAWHLAAATVGADERVAYELATTARRSRERGGYADAATALVRAAQLTPDTDRRAERLKDAATSAWLGGRPGLAESCLAQARELRPDPQLDQLRGRFELHTGDAGEALRIFMAGSSLEVLADAAEAASNVGDTEAIVEVGRRAQEFPESFMREVLVGIGTTLNGDRRGGAMALRWALRRTDTLTDAAGYMWASAAAAYLGEADAATAYTIRAGRLARMSGMVGQLPIVLEFVATAERLAGNLAVSEAIAEEGLGLATEAGYTNSVAAHLANLAAVAAWRGDEAACRTYADRALAIAIPHRLGLRVGVAQYALAMLDLGLGRFDAAHARLSSVAQKGPGEGHPTVTWRSTPDRIEAAVGAGDREAARQALAGLERWAANAHSPESQALLARCRALVDDGGFDEALELHTEAFERARTALLHGERLRRTHRPGEARPHLRAAMETFERAGAEPWAKRAHEELRAAGESTTRAEPDGLAMLTPQELRIARLVAQGASSKEVAAKLFLSPRTIEYHLYKIYPKVGVTSRTELARLVVLRMAPVAGDDKL